MLNSVLDTRVKMWTAGCSPQTQTSYRFYIEHLERLTAIHFSKSLLELDEIEVYQLVEILSQNMKASSLHTRVAVLRSFFKYATKKGWVKVNPADDLRPPKFESTLAQRILTHDQVQQLINVTDNSRDRLVIRTLYYAALRRAEITHLRKRDVIQKDEKWSLQVWGKGQRTDFVRIPAELGRDLLTFAATKRPEDFLFTTKTGARMGVHSVHEIIKKAAATAGIPKVSPHWLRHTAATVALSKGANLAVVQKSLRHRHIDTTMKYIHLDPDEGISTLLPALD